MSEQKGETAKATRPREIPAEVLRAWDFTEAEITPVNQGLINVTWKITCSTRVWALQWLNPVFGIENIEDLELLSRRLQTKGLQTPTLKLTVDGQLFFQQKDGIWRSLSWIEGENFDETENPSMCREAGRILGIFHGAFWDSDIELRSKRLPVHNLQRHLLHFEYLLESHNTHPNIEAIRRLARHILHWPDPLPQSLEFPRRLVHGDPKISNIIFDESGHARCLIDLDTPARSPLCDELGDALRSWCRTGLEDEASGFSATRFAATIEGYLDGLGRHQPLQGEILSFAPGAERISLELAARFAADALEERYFAWDSTRYHSASEHNLARAQAQLYLARSISEQQDELREISTALMDSLNPV